MPIHYVCSVLLGTHQVVIGVNWVGTYANMGLQKVYLNIGAEYLFLLVLVLKTSNLIKVHSVSAVLR